MQYIIDLCSFISRVLRKCMSSLMSIPGLLLSGLTGFVALLLSLFTDWDYTTEVVNQIDRASQIMAEQFGVLRSSSSAFLDMVVSFLAIDTLVECMVLLVGATVALVVSTLFTFLAGVVTLAIGILTVRGILKLIRVISGGVVDP